MHGPAWQDNLRSRLLRYFLATFAVKNLLLSSPEKSKDLTAKNAKNFRKVRKGNQNYDISRPRQTFLALTCKICNAVS
jgi:hypothetical protein